MSLQPFLESSSCVEEFEAARCSRRARGPMDESLVTLSHLHFLTAMSPLKCLGILVLKGYGCLGDWLCLWAKAWPNGNAVLGKACKQVKGEGEREWKKALEISCPGESMTGCVLSGQRRSSRPDRRALNAALHFVGGMSRSIFYS